ncbi:MAG TPA: di-heme oxidoredictase family protein [Candidatus Binatia bacterium]|jgi:mono/diheme cytochrome c family protein|nr:di-heme oxidoredictase family protein [Candidatus Binatia bacterium]
MSGTTLRMLALAVMVAGCGGAADEPPATWRADCPPVTSAAPLGIDAARAAYADAERRHEIRLREAAEPGTFLREMHALLPWDELAAGRMCPQEVADLGGLVFEHEYGYADGLGGGTATSNGPFRRVHEGRFGGPETISCASCHWVGGPVGAGAETDNAFLMGDGERPDSGDARNPPALVAPGVVEALAREMTRDLQRQRDDLVRAGTDGEVRLVTKGVDFGVLRVTAKGEVDVAGLDGVDPDLVVKPFGWKGTLPTFVDFSNEALQVHLGVQSADLLARADAGILGAGDDHADPDGDGVRRELDRGPFAAMAVHLALLEMPIVEPMIQDRPLQPAASALLAPTTTSFAEDFQRGRAQFHALGCATCHHPMMVLESPMLAVEGLPPIDLSREMHQPGLRWDAALGGYPVWLFSDLKRHDMGAQNAARHVQEGVPLADYLTPRLWGVADSAPYLHDGRAPSLDYAIAGHDGEGSAARAAYAALSMHEQGALRVYLTSMRRAPRVVVP